MAELSVLTADDIAEVMRLERRPGYEAFVGRWEADEHRARHASADVRYVGLRKGDGLAGFVIFQNFRASTVLLRRIAVDDPGAGTGTRLLRAAMDWAFVTSAAEALELDVALGNPRAKHVYEREGFAEHRPPDDVHYFLSIPRARWAAMRVTETAL